MPVKLKMKQIDLKNEEHIRFLIHQIENEKNRDRKRLAYDAYQCFAGNQGEYVKNLLQDKYPKSYAKFRVGDINYTERVTLKRSKAYKKPPQRVLDADIEKTEHDENSETGKYQEILKSNKANRAFKEMDEIFNLHRYVALWVNYINATDKEEAQYLFQALAPYEYDLFKDEITGKPLIFALNFVNVDSDGLPVDFSKLKPVTYSKLGNTKQTPMHKSLDERASQYKKYSFWNDTQHVQVTVKINIDGDIRSNAKITYVKLEGNKGNKNPIGRLPVTFLSRGLNKNYPVANPLHSQALSWNLDYSDLRTASVIQGHGQLVLTHSDKQALPTELHMGQHQALDLPVSEDTEVPTKAEYINASPDLAGQLSVLKFDAIQILEDHGVKAKGTIEGGVEEFSSGFDRLLAQADAIDILEDNQDLYEDNIEQEVFQIVKAIEKELNNVFKSEKLSIIYEKPKVLISDKETLENIKMREEIGLILPYEKHQIMNPNLSDDEAQVREEAIVKVKEENAEKDATREIDKFQKTIGTQKFPPEEGDKNGKGFNKNT